MGFVAANHDLYGPFIAKLEHGARLTDDDRTRLRQAAGDVRQIEARVTLIQEGDRPRGAHLVLDGIACRCKVLADGSRQILAYLLPGDLCHADIAVLDEMDHSIATISACIIADLSSETIAELARGHPRIARALQWSALAASSTLDEWLVSMGRRSAVDQMAHLFCELLLRLRAIGRTSQDSYLLPLTQEELGDALGLSVVHVNRVLQTLREDGLISFKGKRLTILDVERLKARAGFNPNYLHLEPPRRAA